MSIVAPSVDLPIIVTLLPAVEKEAVLVIEHDPEDRTAVMETLNSAGYPSHCCSDSSTALASARQHTPRLIIADINLAGSSSMRLCEQIKELPHLADVPIIFLSSAQVPDIIRRSHQGGCAYHVRKPFDPQVLIELIGKALWSRPALH